MTGPQPKKKLNVKAKALKLARLGYFVGPLASGSKSPGSRLGAEWHKKTSNEVAVVSQWFKKNPSDGLFLHVGRSGLIAYDLDLDIDDGLDTLPSEIASALRLGVFQRSQGDGDRGHYIFRTDEEFGNGAGGFAAWGDVRGKNGAIVLAPSIHPVTRLPYKHVRGDWAAIPKLPAALRALLRTGVQNQLPALTTDELRVRLDSLSSGSEYALLDERCEEFRTSVVEGSSRHNSLLKTALKVIQDSSRGKYPAGDAIDRLRQEFNNSFAASSNGKRSRPAVGEFDGLIAWAAAQRTPEESLNKLFESTPELQMVSRYAQERTVSKVALLSVGLARALVSLPPRFVLPGTVGTVASLNLFVALTGPSGAGKGLTEGVAGEVFRFSKESTSDVYIGRPGSSEGIAKMYGHIVPKKEGKRVTQIAQYLRSRVLASLPEVDSLYALMGRDSSMISATLREVWSGSRIGLDYAGAQTKFLVGAQTFRFCLLIGVQPDRAETLLRERGGGLLQRFLWVDVMVPPGELPEPTLDESDLTPLPLPGFINESSETQKWLVSMSKDADNDELIALSIPDEVRAQILAAQALIRQGLTSDLEGHRLLVQEKVAMGFALLHHKTDGFTLNHWHMAGLLMQHSDEVLDRMYRESNAKRVSGRMKEAALAGKVRAVRSDSEERALTDKTQERIVALITQHRQIGGAKLRGQLSGRQREVFALAIQELSASKVIGIKVRQAKNGEKSTFYYLVST